MLAEASANLSHNLIADTFGRLWVSCHALIVTVNCHAHYHRRRDAGRELVRGHPSKFVLYLSGAGNGPLKPSSANPP